MVAIIDLEDGSRALTIEGLQTDTGPDLYADLDDVRSVGICFDRFSFLFGAADPTERQLCIARLADQ